MSSSKISPLHEYNLLGHTGLRVSRLCLGTMYFGEAAPLFAKLYGVSANQEEQAQIFDRYCSLGGNFIDTANIYQEGRSESLLGDLISSRGNREELVLATKGSSFTGLDVHKVGNSKKCLREAVDASLKRLQTSYLDLYYVHFWDFTRNGTDLIRDLNDLVRAGKVLHLGISDAPAWCVTESQMAAKFHNLEPFGAYQGRYSLVDRSLERDVLPMCSRWDLGAVAWSTVGGGKLSGKHTRSYESQQKEGKGGGSSRKVVMSESDYDIADKVQSIAEEIGGGASSAQVSLRWALEKPGISSVLVGARTLEQFEDSVKALELEMTKEQMTQLETVSKDQHVGFPHNVCGSNPQNCPWLYVANSAYKIRSK